MASGAAKRYVQAIVEIAREKQGFEAWGRDLDHLGEMFADERVAAFLVNPSVPAARKKQAVEVVLKDAQPEARNLATILIEGHRTNLIPEIVDGFHEAVLTELGIVIADVTTAEPLDDAMQTAVKEQLGTMLGKTVELRLHTDPEIIGGLVARIGDQVIDGSVQTRLRRLRRRLKAS